MTVHETMVTPPTGPGKVLDDATMLRAAVDLTRDISTADPAVYWPDFLVSATVGWGGLAAPRVLASGLNSVTALPSP